MYQNGKLLSNIDELLSLNTDYETIIKYEMCNGGKSRKRVAYINLPFSFDIETSSFYVDELGRTYTNEYVAELIDKIDNRTITEDERNLYFRLDKRNIMYIWQIAINGNCVVGRTWEEFEETIHRICAHFELFENRRFICFVHNLSYEMQYIRKRFDWLVMFARETRKALKALSTLGIEFRCSYMLSGYSLEKTFENLTKYKIEKKVGDLDYSLIRTPLTPINETEMGYCVNDVIGLNAYIQEQIEMYGDITKIPMTNTGRVRLKCRDYCFNDRNGRNYRRLMKTLKITGLDEYSSLKRAFQGGFTHASVLKSGKVYNNVKSWDFTSSYPTVLVSELFPMSTGIHYDAMTYSEVKELSKTKGLIFDIAFDWLEEKVRYEHPLSVSKCWNLKSPCEDNGRLVSCEHCETTITNVDLDIYEEMYQWDGEPVIKDVWVYEMAYLPTPFIQAILDFYYDKTRLKDVEGFEAEYMNKKGMNNSCFGMIVTDIITEIINYLDNVWSTEKGDSETQLNQYNKSSKRFLFYPWGVFVTAYARRNLFYGINEFKEDYIYADTDSVKVLNYENHMTFIEKYNEWIIDRLTKACNYHKIELEKVMPKTVKGEVKPLGVWDDDGDYLRFKTLGAKRYLVEYYDKKKECNQLKCTIAGVSKKDTSKWFMKDYDNAFDNFDNLMCVPREYSGRLICAYIDNETEGYVDDYLGQRYHYHELSSIHMQGSSYNLTMTPMYIKLLNGIEEQATWE